MTTEEKLKIAVEALKYYERYTIAREALAQINAATPPPEPAPQRTDCGCGSKACRVLAEPPEPALVCRFDDDVCNAAHKCRHEPAPQDDNYVAWMRYTRNTIVACDSDAERAFKVYRQPKTEPTMQCGVPVKLRGTDELLYYCARGGRGHDGPHTNSSMIPAEPPAAPSLSSLADKERDNDW